ncbi:hypothetical protein JD969_14985 [Planctomycetota bacterium]|nr:hypothetical protein JD969_14985 [Planctomycetota bacterium]
MQKINKTSSRLIMLPLVLLITTPLIANSSSLQQINQLLTQLKTQSQSLDTQSADIDNTLANITTEIDNDNELKEKLSRSESYVVENPQFKYTYKLRRITRKDLTEYKLKEKYNLGLQDYNLFKKRWRKYSTYDMEYERRYGDASSFFDYFKKDYIILTFGIINKSDQPERYTGYIAVYPRKPRKEEQKENFITQIRLVTPLVKPNKTHQFNRLITRKQVYYARHALIRKLVVHTKIPPSEQNKK